MDCLLSEYQYFIFEASKLQFFKLETDCNIFLFLKDRTTLRSERLAPLYIRKIFQTKTLHCLINIDQKMFWGINL